MGVHTAQAEEWYAILGGSGSSSSDCKVLVGKSDFDSLCVTYRTLGSNAVNADFFRD